VSRRKTFLIIKLNDEKQFFRDRLSNHYTSIPVSSGGFIRPGGRVVRQQIARLMFTGSNPVLVSGFLGYNKKTGDFYRWLNWVHQRLERC
jgi:hypothetical protein